MDHRERQRDYVIRAHNQMKNVTVWLSLSPALSHPPLMQHIFFFYFMYINKLYFTHIHRYVAIPCLGYQIHSCQFARFIPVEIPIVPNEKYSHSEVVICPIILDCISLFVLMHHFFCFLQIKKKKTKHQFIAWKCHSLEFCMLHAYVDRGI